MEAVIVHMGHKEELSFQRMETLKNVNEVVKDIENEYGKAIAIDQGDFSTRLTYGDRVFYVTKM